MDSKLQVISTLKRLRRPCTTLDLAKNLNKTRKDANPMLYDMQKEGLITKVQEANPPMWDLTSEGYLYSTRKQNRGQSSFGRGRGLLGLPASAYTPSGPGNADTDVQINPQPLFQERDVFEDTLRRKHLSDGQEKIVHALEGVTKALTALEVAHAVGLKTRKEVNPDLYALEKDGLVSKNCSSGPPLWTSASKQFTGHLEIGRGRGRGLHSPRKQDESMYGRRAADFSHAYARNTQVSGREPAGSADAEYSVMTLSQKTSNIDLAQSRVAHGNDAERDGPRQPSLSSCGFPMEVVPPKAVISSLISPQKSSLASPTPTFSASVVNDINRNPVSALTEHCQAFKLELNFVDLREFGPPHKRHFVVAAKVGQEMHEPVDATSRKEARRMAADLALRHIKYHEVSTPLLPVHPLLLTTTTATATTAAISNTMPSQFAEEVAKLVHDHYTKVQSTVEFPQPGRKVIAGFVMEDGNTGMMQVVSIGSGTRCITGDHMSMEGTVVNDSHAEVVARRSLLRFLYKQIHKYHSSSAAAEDCIFGEESSVLLRLKPDLKFHLYISTAPCGDGAQFSRGDEQNREPPQDMKHAPTMQGKQQGVLRTKMEGGEGTIPITTDHGVQTWDGILRGERLRTMSCSDKVGRWNVLGLQGALLSCFMEPVYMASLTLGSLHHHGHLCRAVCCRFAELSNSLPPGFLVNHPLLCRVQGGDEIKRHTEKTCNFSLNWALGDNNGELVDGRNGRLVSAGNAGGKSLRNSEPPRVSKISLYAEFFSVAMLRERKELVGAKSYKETKQLAMKFQEAKTQLFKHCERKGYGSWMNKPSEEEQFDAVSLLDRLKLNSQGES